MPKSTTSSAATLPHSLCLDCQKLLSGNVHPRPKSKWMLVRRSGCGLCQVVSHVSRKLAFDPRSPTKIRYHHGNVEVTALLALEPCKSFKIFSAPGTNRRPFSPLNFSLLLTSIELSCPWKMLPSLALPGREYLAMGSLRWALNCVRKCSSTHKCEFLANTLLPPRVIDIGNPERIRLRNSRGAIGKYVCLSHCWGKHQPLKTMEANLNAHLHAIPPRSIPKMYQDAIQVTRLLGIRYLWIDSLCIVQDSTDDWNEQSALMWSIYANCYLAIAATSAKDATEGFLGLKERHSLEIRGKTTNNAPYRFLGLAMYHHPTSSQTLDGGSRWPLLGRGWVLQERLLAPRVMHFTSDEVLWECQERCMCQCGGFNESIKQRFSSVNSELGHDYLVASWHDVVSTYSALKLTRDNDKLPAISGLSRRMMFERRLGTKYLAGLWEDSIEMDLLWINLAQDTQPKPLDWRAPSWSWASINSQVMFPFTRTIPGTLTKLSDVFFSVNDAQTSLATVDFTGQVSSARLTITGRVFPGPLVASIKEDIVWNIMIQWQLPSFTSPSPLSINLLYFDHPDLINSGYRPGSLYFVRLARVRRCTTSSAGRVVVEAEYALIVHWPDPSVGEYRRVGMAVQNRLVEGNHPLLYATWSKYPSCFETGGDLRTIHLV
jgi:Heterokaryon incompatibility protein (HET)